MGSSMSRIYDEQAEDEFTRKKEWLKSTSKKIEEIYPNSSEYTDLNWLMNNKEKILRNRRLIDLLG